MSGERERREDGHDARVLAAEVRRLRSEVDAAQTLLRLERSQRAENLGLIDEISRALGVPEGACGNELLAELAQVTAPITAADVRAAEKAWEKKRRDEAWPWVENLSLDHDTFMADWLNRRGAGPDEGVDRTESEGEQG